MDTILMELKQRPNLKSLVQELNQYVQEEEKLRQAFYNQISEEYKAEFINGEIIIHPPARRIHGLIKVNLLVVINVFVDMHELGEGDGEKRMIELTRNSYQPDIVCFLNDKVAHFKDDQMLFPAPDFIVEILSPSTEKNDRGVKFVDYALHGVGEYWVIDPEEKTVEQFILQEGQYALALKAVSGTITSQVIQGFSIPVKAIFDKKENKLALQSIVGAKG